MSQRTRRRLLAAGFLLWTALVVYVLLPLDQNGTLTGFVMLFLGGVAISMGTDFVIPTDAYCRAVTKVYGHTALATIFSVVAVGLCAWILLWDASAFRLGSLPLSTDLPEDGRFTQSAEFTVMLAGFAAAFAAGGLQFSLGMGTGGSKLPSLKYIFRFIPWPKPFDTLTYWTIRPALAAVTLSFLSRFLDLGDLANWKRPIFEAAVFVAISLALLNSVANWFLVQPLRWALTIRLVWRLAMARA